MLVNQVVGQSYEAKHHGVIANSLAAISASKILLVPYCEHHVSRYHEWMQDPV
jgi:hypothetical protein